jgi:voltage-gated potassium channel Kch
VGVYARRGRRLGRVLLRVTLDCRLQIRDKSAVESTGVASMKRYFLRERFRYQFDNYMSKGTVALIGGLAVMSLAVIALAGLAVTLGGSALAPAGGAPLSFLEASWAALMRTLDAGTMGGDAGWGFRIVMFLVTLGGVFIISTLIGVLTTGVESKLDELRKGRSRVIERNHTVILGWSPQVFSIVSELVIANENQKNPCIVVLGDKDKVEMEDEIREKAGDLKNTRVVCRTGKPIDLNDLEIVNLNEARSIIILPPDTGNADSHTIKTILAITNNPARRAEEYHIVTEIRDPRNLEAARLVGRHETELILAGDLIARITAQTCRQSGLSVVYTELLDFGGDEIYFKEEPRLAGQTFGAALFAYEDSSVIGLRFKDGRIALNPPMDTVLQAGDKIIAIAEDDDTIELSGLKEHGIEPTAILAGRDGQPAPERTLILGWNQRAPVIINELDNYVAPGSSVMVVASEADADDVIRRECDRLKNETVSFREGDVTQRRVLNDLDFAAYDHVIVLSDASALDPQDADARTLVTLLHLRDMADREGRSFAIVSEMLDIRNRELATVTRADDFIVSDKLISLMLSQISENKELTAVFRDMFDPEGSELYLKPADRYVTPGATVNFYTVLESARRKGEIAIGYRLRAKAGDPAAAYGVVVNPLKSVPIMLGDRDSVIVVAEN